MEYSLLISAFVAGILTFLAPCTLPIVPAYLGFISGVDMKSLKEVTGAKGARHKIIQNAVAFVFGFSLIFVLMGFLFGWLGSLLVVYQTWLSRIGGGLIIVAGLSMLKVFEFNFLAIERKPQIWKWLQLGRPISSFIIGGTFAVGWSPCVGPILASILLLAGTSGTVLAGTFLLAVFSLGLAIPFLLVAFWYAKATHYIGKSTKYIKVASVISGVFLVGLGFLIMTNNFQLLIIYGYAIFDFINYDTLLEYL
ncbi:cytochrome c biogenesis protein CcdA [Candidatus Kaiserbacteria bacterium]|nr:cytochrome c biogenesis protein CcdA [Candidatus Kaiserbacteria bacterium]